MLHIFNAKVFYYSLIFMCFVVFVYENKSHLVLNSKYTETVFYFNTHEEELKPNSVLLVNMTYCKIVRWQTIDKDVMPLFENHTNDELKCKTKSHNISIERINFNGIVIENKLNKSVQCFAQSVVRKDDLNIEFGPKVFIDVSNITYFPDDIAVRVNCIIEEDKDQLAKVLPLIPEPQPRRVLDEEMPNILMVGIDSVSRLNFERHFVRTARLLSDHNFYTLYGYNKVGDNTFPNLTPLLTGFYPDNIWNGRIRAQFDYLPFIWRAYQQRGYQSYYFEDAPNINTFNYVKPGFKNPPTDYYLRTYCMAMDDQVKNFCYLDKPATEVYCDYLYDFVRAMNARDQRYFAFHFMAKLTHDHLNHAGYMDKFTFKLFENLFKNNLLNNTIIVFFADHGIRFGKIRETLSGKYEERLPFAHIYVPEEWRNRNLSINQHRLTTPFDIHATLKHILLGVPDKRLKYGKTLFEEIPEDRSCQSVPISERWCGCQTSKVVDDLNAIKPFSEFIVKELNKMLNKFSDKCSKLVFKETLSATEQSLSESAVSYTPECKEPSGQCPNPRNDTKHYVITVRVDPSDALLEASVNYDNTSRVMSIVGDISRINLYGNQSHCMNDAFLKKYCFCNDLIKH